jgi:hypothetical protein
LLLEAEGNIRGATSARAQAAEKHSAQLTAAAKIEVLQKQQDAVQQQFQFLNAAFERSKARLELQTLEDEQWTVADALLKVQHVSKQWSCVLTTNIEQLLSTSPET